jgi:hypothetical protein
VESPGKEKNLSVEWGDDSVRLFPAILRVNINEGVRRAGVPERFLRRFDPAGL